MHRCLIIETEVDILTQKEEMLSILHSTFRFMILEVPQKIVNIVTLEIFAIIILKFDLYGLPYSYESKICRRNDKHCRHCTFCSDHSATKQDFYSKLKCLIFGLSMVLLTKAHQVYWMDGLWQKHEWQNYVETATSSSIIHCWHIELLFYLAGLFCSIYFRAVTNILADGTWTLSVICFCLGYKL